MSKLSSYVRVETCKCGWFSRSTEGAYGACKECGNEDLVYKVGQYEIVPGFFNMYKTIVGFKFKEEHRE